MTVGGGEHAWLVLDPAAARAALADPRLRRSTQPAGQLAERFLPREYAAIHNHLLMREGPEHARMRRLVNAAFTTQRVAALAPRITRIATDLLDALDDGEVADLVAAYALPLPLTVICELLGVPPELRAPLRTAIATLIDGLYADPADYIAAVSEHAALCRELVALRRAHPADDLSTGLVAARDGSDRLSEDELTSMLSLLVVAGHETTAHLIGNGVHLLLSHPSQLALLRAEPWRMGAAVEEILRVAGALHSSLPLTCTSPSSWPGCRWPRVRRFSSRCSPRREQALRTSTSNGTRPGTWRSATASTTAWARRWRGSKHGPPSTPS